jgi:hypothetical protein
VVEKADQQHLQMVLVVEVLVVIERVRQLMILTQRLL